MDKYSIDETGKIKYENNVVIIEPGPRREIPVFNSLIEIENTIPVKVIRTSDSIIFESDDKSKFKVFSFGGYEML